MSFVLLTDSACNLPEAMIRELQIEIISLTFSCEGKEYQGYIPGVPNDNSKFYAMLREGKKITTSAANMDTLRNAMEPFLQRGEDVLYLAFSSGLSGTCHTAQLAAKELSEEYPERRIEVLDTLCACLGQGLLVYYAAKMRLDGSSLEEVLQWSREHQQNVCHWFTVEDLHFLKRGGRISAATALVGTALGIKPVMHMDDHGHLAAVGKTRGREKSLLALVDQMEKYVTDPENQLIFIGHGDCLKDAERIEREVRCRFAVKNVLIGEIDPVIGAHSGPGTAALFFLGSAR